MVKSPPWMQEAGFNSWVGKSPCSRKWVPTPVFLPEDSHGRRRLVGCSPWGRKESDMTEQLTLCYTWHRKDKMTSVNNLHWQEVVSWWRWFRCSAMSDSLRPHGLFPPDSSVHGILQARILEWVAIFSSRESFWLRCWTCISFTAGGFFTAESPRKLWQLISWSQLNVRGPGKFFSFQCYTLEEEHTSVWQLTVWYSRVSFFGFIIVKESRYSNDMCLDFFSPQRIWKSIHSWKAASSCRICLLLEWASRLFDRPHPPLRLLHFAPLTLWRTHLTSCWSHYFY